MVEAELKGWCFFWFRKNFTCYVINQDRHRSIFQIARNQTLELFLPGSVPEAELDDIVPVVDGLHGEIHSHGWLNKSGFEEFSKFFIFPNYRNWHYYVILFESVMHKSIQKASFPNILVPQEHNFQFFYSAGITHLFS